MKRREFIGFFGLAAFPLFVLKDLPTLPKVKKKRPEFIPVPSPKGKDLWQQSSKKTLT